MKHQDDSRHGLLYLLDRGSRTNGSELLQLRYKSSSQIACNSTSSSESCTAWLQRVAPWHSWPRLSASWLHWSRQRGGHPQKTKPTIPGPFLCENVDLEMKSVPPCCTGHQAACSLFNHKHPGRQTGRQTARQTNTASQPA